MIKLKKTKLKQKQKQKQSVNVIVNVGQAPKQASKERTSGSKRSNPQPRQPPRPQSQPPQIQYIPRFQPQVIKSGVQLDDVIRNNDTMRQFVRDAVVNPKNHVDHSEMIKKYVKDMIRENMPKNLPPQTPSQTLDTPFPTKLFQNLSDDPIISKSDQEEMEREAENLDNLDGKEEDLDLEASLASLNPEEKYEIPSTPSSSSSSSFSSPSSSFSSSSSSDASEPGSMMERKKIETETGYKDTGFDFIAKNTKKVYKIFTGPNGGIIPFGDDNKIRALSTFTKIQQDQIRKSIKKD